MKYLLLVAFWVVVSNANTQTVVVAFYNLENLYDTVDNPLIDDEEFLPHGAKHYGTEIYRHKLFNLATVLSSIGKQYDDNGAALIGVAEIENDTVLTDLKNHFLLRHRNYGFVHFDSRDGRGIDVALFFRKKIFHVLHTEKLEVQLPGGSKEAAFTRDILYVRGILQGDTISVLVNHWPSRRGGEARSAPARATAAGVARKKIDQLLAEHDQEKIILMGDLNDNPTDKSVSEVLRGEGVRSKVKEKSLFNPWVAFFNKGIGTLANQDSWGLFDQILVSKSLLQPPKNGLKYSRAEIFYQPYLTESAGRYRGYPLRTWEGNSYRGGFSDHFPTFIVLSR